MAKKEASNESILDKFKAMEGLVLRANEKIDKVKNLIAAGQQIHARNILKEALHDLRQAYLLSLYRRNKAYVSQFRTLKLLPQRVENMNKMAAAFQGLLEIVRDKMQTAVLAKNDQDFVKEFGKMKKAKVLFSFAKELVEKVEETPSLEENYEEYLNEKDEFRGIDQKKKMLFWNKWMESRGGEPLKLEGVNLKFNPNLFKFDNCIFEKCRFNQWQMTYTRLSNCTFLGCMFYRCEFQRSFTDHVFKNCNFKPRGGKTTFYRCSGILDLVGCELENVVFVSPYEFGLWVKDCKLKDILFKKSIINYLYLIGGTIEDIKLLKCDILKELKIFDVKKAIGLKIHSVKTNGFIVGGSYLEEAEFIDFGCDNYHDDLDHGSIVNDSFANCHFVDCRMKMEFHKCKFNNTSFERCIFEMAGRGAFSAAYREGLFEHCEAEGLMMEKCRLPYPKFLFQHSGKVSGAIFKDFVINQWGKDESGDFYQIKGSRFDKIVFKGDITKFVFTRCNFVGCNFEHAKFNYDQFVKCTGAPTRRVRAVA